ncbi:uncharacterized protein [Argopecten irradians]|uniref:uncharacterized protein n=1 Tax=Argopecten irradians TaxID=31199 RepID=UPI00371F6218
MASSTPKLHERWPLQLPISSLVEEFKVIKARQVMTVRHSKDDNIRFAGIETRTGRKMFLLRSVYDLLPSPTNLHRWGLTETPDCPLCNRPGNLALVLSGYNVALTQGRYRWRHDKVLNELADILERERIRSGSLLRVVHSSTLYEAGREDTLLQLFTRGGILDGAQNWEMRVDLDRRLVSPEIIQTNLRPDILIWSTQGKKMVTVELTVPWEERCEEAFERKKGKYEEFVGDIGALGWR